MLSRPLRFLAILMAGYICSLCQADSEKPRPKRLWALTNLTINTADDVNADTWEANGLVGRSTESRVFVFDPWFLDFPARRVLLHPVDRNKKVMLSAKFRYGSFYRRYKNEVQRFEPSLARWVTLLQAPTGFAQFDVTEDGRILLISTGEPFSHDLHPLETYQDQIKPDTSNLIEVFDPLGEVAIKKIPFPEEVRKIHEQVWSIWPVDRVWNFQDTVVLWQQSTGLLYRFDVQTNRLDMPELPWHTLLNTYFPEGRPKFPGGSESDPALIDRGAFPIYPQFYPAGNHRVVLAMGFVFQKIGQPRPGSHADGKPTSLPYPKDLQCQEIPDTTERVGVYVWDLHEGGIKRIALNPKPGPVFGPSQMWIEPDGSWRTFADMIKTLDPPKPPPERAGAKPLQDPGTKAPTPLSDASLKGTQTPQEAPAKATTPNR